MYSSLYIKTDYSLLSSLIKIDDLIEKLKTNNITSCAIIDDNLFSTMEVVTKFKKNNLKPIIGLEIKIDEINIILIAKNYQGYLKLVKIETLKNKKTLNYQTLSKYTEELICIVSNETDFKTFTKIYKDIFIRVSNKKEEENIKTTDKIVFMNKTLYLNEYEYKYLPYLFMIRDSKTISDGIEFKYSNNYLLTQKEALERASSLAINNTLKISDMCNLKFKKELFMPKYDVPDSKEYLKELSYKGLTKRLNNNISDKYKQRLNYELKIITNMHFEDYFLVVYDYIKYAKKNKIMVGPGRGSAAGSLVSYSLGITDVDPLKYDLLFERFLNPERITMPDIDTDFSDIGRDQVIEYVREKYGNEKVAGIITFGTLGGRQIVRDVGRILNIYIKDIDYICKKIDFKETLKEVYLKNKDIKNYIDSDDKLTMLYKIVSLIEGVKRHTSQHAAGIVISYKNIDEIIPLVPSADNLNLTEYTMEYLEDIGLIKMDFLGIRNLTIIDNIIKDIEKHENKKIDINKINLEDEKVYKVFSNGDTTGIFQFESEGMKKLLRELKPQSFKDLSAAIALFRPGPASNIPLYIKRMHKKEKITYIDDSLKPILEETNGIIIYQEQIMLIANKMANYTFAEADLLRRAMSKKKLSILKQEEKHFINGSIKNGYTQEKAKEVYELILKFANYGFNKSHSVCYSIVAYQMGYLKCYYPKYFYSNLLGGVIGSEIKTLEYIREIKKMGIKLLPANVNLSDANKYLVLPQGIIFPLSSIKSIGNIISNSIINKRKDEYKDIFDFIKQNYKEVNNKKVLENLIYSHALDDFEPQEVLLYNLESILNYVSLSMSLEEIPKPNLIKPKEIEFDSLEKEKDVYGFYLTSHKTEKYKLKLENIKDIYDLSNMLNKKASIVVSLDRKKEILTKKGEAMSFYEGTDNTGTISITVFPEIYKDIKEIKTGDIIKVDGIVEKRYDEYQLIAKKIELLSN